MICDHVVVVDVLHFIKFSSTICSLSGGKKMACLFFIRDLEFSRQLSKVKSRTNDSQKLVHGGGSIPFNNFCFLLKNLLHKSSIGKHF